MSLTNRKIPALLLQLIKYSGNLIDVQLGLNDYDQVTYKVAIPGKYERILLTETHSGIVAETRYDQSLSLETISDFYDVAIDSIECLQTRNGETGTDPVEGLTDGWIKVGVEIGRIEEVKTVIYRSKR